MMTYWKNIILFVIKSALTDIKKEFDSKPVYNKTVFKTKIRSHSDKATEV